MASVDRSYKIEEYNRHRMSVPFNCGKLYVRHFCTYKIKRKPPCIGRFYDIYSTLHRQSSRTDIRNCTKKKHSMQDTSAVLLAAEHITMASKPLLGEAKSKKSQFAY